MNDTDCQYNPYAPIPSGLATSIYTLFSRLPTKAIPPDAQYCNQHFVGACYLLSTVNNVLDCLHFSKAILNEEPYEPVIPLQGCGGFVPGQDYLPLRCQQLKTLGVDSTAMVALLDASIAELKEALAFASKSMDTIQEKLGTIAVQNLKADMQPVSNLLLPIWAAEIVERHAKMGGVDPESAHGCVYGHACVEEIRYGFKLWTEDKAALEHKRKQATVDERRVALESESRELLGGL
ncbi:MAG: hypothetical protein MI808_22025 [Pseudomonadales bacterium]|nr:hypothetical protein [Pseudomonadales bacterium]